MYYYGGNKEYIYIIWLHKKTYEIGHILFIVRKSYTCLWCVHHMYMTHTYIKNITFVFKLKQRTQFTPYVKERFELLY